jgi:peptide/nickel transport system permease protein
MNQTAIASRSRRRPPALLRPLLSSPTAAFGSAVVLLWILVAIFAPALAPYGPNAIDSKAMNQPPSALHLMGTDTFGRDVLSRIIHGSRPVLLIAPASVMMSLIVGIFLGLTAGYRGGWVDELIMRAVDIVLSFPTVLIYLIIIAAVGPSPVNIVIAVTIAGAPGVARLVRSLTLDIATRDYVAAAKLRAESTWYIMFVEILPNARGPLIIDAMLRVGYAILAIGVLGFLGLGLRPPTADWGSMINEARKVGTINPAAMVWPSLAIASLVVALNLAADGMREELSRYQH